MMGHDSSLSFDESASNTESLERRITTTELDDER